MTSPTRSERVLPTRVVSRWICSALGLITVVTITGCVSSGFVDFSSGISPPSRTSGTTATLSRSSQYLPGINQAVIDEGPRNRWKFSLALATAERIDRQQQHRFKDIWDSTRALVEQHRVTAEISTDQELAVWYRTHPERELELTKNLVEGFFGHGIFLNVTVSSRNPFLLIPLTDRRPMPDAVVVSTLDAMFGTGSAASLPDVLVVDEPGLESHAFAGITLGSAAIINSRRCNALAVEYGVDEARIRNVVVANELVHVLLELRYGPQSARSWSLSRVSQKLRMPFALTVHHVDEFLSDIASVQVDPIGLTLIFANLFDGSVTSNASGKGIGDVESPYGLSAEFFLRAYAMAERDAGVPESARQARTLRQLAARGDINLVGELVSARIKPEVASHMVRQYQEVSELVLSALGKRASSIDPLKSLQTVGVCPVRPSRDNRDVQPGSHFLDNA